MRSHFIGSRFDRVLNTTATGTTTITSDAVTGDGESNAFIVLLGAVTDNAANKVVIQYSDDGTTWTDIPDSETLITTGTNKVVVIELNGDRGLQYRAKCVRTGTYAIDGILYVSSQRRISPATQADGIILNIVPSVNDGPTP